MKKRMKRMLATVVMLSVLLVNSIPVFAAGETFYDKYVTYTNTKLSSSKAQGTTSTTGSDYVRVHLKIQYRLNNIIYTEDAGLGWYTGKVAVSRIEDKGSASEILAIGSDHEAIFYISGASRTWKGTIKLK